MKIYFVTTIDTECDKRIDWSVRYPFEFRNITEGIPEKLMPLLHKYGVKPTFLLSPEVIADEGCSTYFKALGNESELGTHLHGEFVEPLSDFKAYRTDEYQADYSYEIEKAKVYSLTELFRKRFGYQPISFRAGRFGVSKSTLEILFENGYRVDSSIFPFNKISTKAHQYNFYYYPVKPYYPDLKNYAKRADHGEEKILHIPITVSSPLFQSLPQWFGKPLSESVFGQRLMTILVGKNRMRTVSLRPSTNTFAKMKEVYDRYISRHQPGEVIFVNMMFHSNELIENTSPYCKTPEDIELFIKRLDQIYEHAGNMGAEFIKMCDCCDILKAEKMRM